VMLVGGSSGGAVLCGFFGTASWPSELIQAAALMSGACAPRFVTNAYIEEYTPFPPLDELQTPLIELTGCDEASSVTACLRDLPVDTLLHAAERVPPAPGTDVNVFPTLTVIDNQLVHNPYEYLVSGGAGDFPLIVGSTRDETRNLLSLPAMDDAGYRSWLATSFGTEVATQLYEAYPPSDYPTLTDAAYMLTADLSFGCPAEALAKAAGHDQSAYLYLLTRDAAGSDYVPHGTAADFIFGNPEEHDQAWADIGSAILSGWSTLAAHPYGMAPEVDAGASGTFVWPEYTADHVQVLELGDPVQIVDQYRGGRCDVLGPIIDFHF